MQQRAKGLVAILVQDTCHSEEITINTNLEVVTSKTYLPKELTICCVYLPLDLQLSENELENIKQQLTEPFLICGDFNAHNVLWVLNSRPKR